LAYVWIRLLHVAAASVWMLGLLATAVATFPAADAPAGSRGAAPPAGPSGFVRGMARWDVRVTLPAMLLALACGGYLGSAGWFGQAWLSAKLAIVGMLVLLQAAYSVALRRLAARPGYRTPGWLGLGSMVVFAGGLSVVLLAAVKPQF